MGWDDDYDDWEGYHADWDDELCDHPNLDVDVFAGTKHCGRCGYRGVATNAEIEAEIRFRADYEQSVAEEYARPTPASADGEGSR
jgi:hypothetical protein